MIVFINENKVERMKHNYSNMDISEVKDDENKIIKDFQLKIKSALRIMQDVSDIIICILQNKTVTYGNLNTMTGLKIMRFIRLDNPKIAKEITILFRRNTTCFEGMLYVYFKSTINVLSYPSTPVFKNVLSDLTNVRSFMANLCYLEIPVNLMPTLDTFIQFIITQLEQTHSNVFRAHFFEILITLASIEDCSKVILEKLLILIENCKCCIKSNNYVLTPKDTEVLTCILHLVSEINSINFIKMQLTNKSKINNKAIIQSIKGMQELVSNGILYDLINTCLSVIM